MEEPNLIDTLNHRQTKPHRLNPDQIDQLIDEILKNMRNGVRKNVNGIIDFSSGMYFTKCVAEFNREPGQRAKPLFPLKNGGLKGKIEHPQTGKTIKRTNYFRELWDRKIENYL